MNADQIAQLAKTFSIACKDAVEKRKVQTYSAPIVLSVVTVLLSPSKLLPAKAGSFEKRLKAA